MPKIEKVKIQIYTMLLIVFLLNSCSQKEKVYSNQIFDDKKTEIESKLNFKTVNNLNETNKKVIEIASIAFNNSKELKKSQLILKIKKDHQKIEQELKKITEENLIITPEPIFDLNLNESFLNGINSNFYLFSLLEKEIKNQISLLDSIENTTKDIDFKNFADKSKEVLINNKELLGEHLEI